MTLRIPLAIDYSDDGLDVEIPSSDTVDLRAGAEVAGNIAFSSGEPTGLPSTPSGATAAASKAYVDSIAAGLNPRPFARVASNNDLDTWAAAGSGVGATLTSPGNATSYNDIDSVTVAVGDRVLVKDYGAASSDADNGIYEVTQLADGATLPCVLTRATDFDENAEVNQGDSCFISEGTVNAKRTYALITGDPITVDTTAQEWTIVSGPGALTAGAGLADAANVWSVELDTTAGATGGGNGGGSSGLEYDTTGDNAKLRAAVSAAGAMQRAADGLSVKLEASNPSLAIVSNELGVKLDTSRAITKNASGIGVNIETTNPGLQIVGNELGPKLDGTRGLAKDGSGQYTKVDGSTITFDGSGQLQVGAAPASRISAAYAVNEAIAKSDPVQWSSTNDRVEKSRADTAGKARVAGLAETAQAVVGNTSTIVSHGPAVNVLVAATAGQIYWLQPTGGIGTSLPGAGNRLVVIGAAKNATDLFVSIRDRSRRAS